MSDKPENKRSISADWLIGGTLTKIGDIFDRLTGRRWKPSSSLATSELIERMKSMMDAEVRENGDNRRYVPHNIKLKMQWDKFSTDSEQGLRKLENEFLIAAIDHINDRHYFTYAPLQIEVKPDYFTSGVKLFLSFDKLEGDGSDAELNVTVDNLKTSDLISEIPNVPEKHSGQLRLSFSAAGKELVRNIALEEGKRLSVGRTKENDVAIDDQSISKAHASLLLNKDGKLIVADTGSTNGTFVRGERIAYGKANEIVTGDSLLFGLVKVDVSFALAARPEPPPAQTYKVGDIEFKSKSDIPVRVPPIHPISEDNEERKELTIINQSPAPTVAAVPVPKEMISPISSPAPNSNVAPQPQATETNIKITEEKQDWEV